MGDVQMIVLGISMMIIGSATFLNLDENVEHASWRYTCSIFFMFSVGFPIGNTAVLGLFSKIVGRRPQGTLQGLFVSAGSLSRIIFPIASGYIAHLFGLQPLFTLVVIVLSITVLSALVNRKILKKLSI